MKKSVAAIVAVLAAGVCAVQLGTTISAPTVSTSTTAKSSKNQVVETTALKQQLVKDNTTQVLVDQEVKGEDVVKIVQHGDHWHVHTRDGREVITYTDPNQNNGAVLEMVSVVSLDELKNMDVVSVALHGDHWHVHTRDGKEYVTYRDPSALFSNVTVNPYAPHPVHVHHSAAATAQAPKIDVVRIAKHGDHYHLYTRDGKEAVVYSDPRHLYPNAEYNEYGGGHHDHDETPVLAVKHGDHWHLYADLAGTDEIGSTHDNPKIKYPNIKVVEEHHDHEHHHHHDETPVLAVKHGDHWHLYADLEGKDEIGSTHDDPKIKYPNIKVVEEHHNHEHHDHENHENETPVLAVKHGDHWHLYADLAGTDEIGETHDDPKIKYPNIKVVEEHHNGEGDHHQFAFDPKDIVSEDTEGYVVRHGDHFHYIYKKDLPVDFVKPHEKEKSEEPTKLPDNLEEKINYIIAAYGVPREAIKVHNGYFVFNEPTHEYDPSHIHPYAIPVDKLKVPVMTDDKEADFENEWLSIAERMGVSPEQLEIKDGYFVISHGDHSHYVKIMSGGEKEYFKNKLPDIVGAFVRGDLDKDVVINKAQELEKQAENTYKDDPKQLRRIKTALRQFKEKVALGGNSTQGYLDMLAAFEKQYILLNKEEALSAEDQALAQKHSELVDKINRLNLSRFSITKENLLDKLYKVSESKNLQRLNDLDLYINGFNDLRARPGITGLQFLDYLLAHVDDKELSYDTRESVSNAIYESYEASIMNRKSIFSIFHLIADAKDAIRLSHEKPEETNHTKTGPKYARLDEPFEWRVPSVREDAKRFVEDVRGLIGPTDPTPTPSNFKEKPVSVTPKPNTAVNRVEEDTTNRAVSETPNSSEEVSTSDTPEVSTSEMPEGSSETEEKESRDVTSEMNNKETESEDSDVVRVVNPTSEEVEGNSTQAHH
ncbi:pneumococcal-type histidine triad protein [Carnobacteriaceae bacterium zg-C25]|nr:pneumococcal-type histidine triad protein [Carnobacteriaceae bacterium zg-C25]